MVGADKGGVGKTTVSRALDDYLHVKKAAKRTYDTQSPNGDLARFVAEASIIDAMNIDDQMKVFDSMRGVTLMDIKGGMFTDVLQSLRDVRLLDEVRDGRLNLLLLHVLGPSASSLGEIAYVAESLGTGANHVLVKNYVNESGFREWEADPRFASTLASARVIEVPHLPGRACTEIQRLGVPFADYAEGRENSFTIRGHVRTWLAKVYAAFDAAGIGQLVEETK